MTRMDDETLRDLAPAYAMGTLPLPERVAFEAALAAHPWLREEVEAHRAVLDALATSERLAPPPALKARTMARLASADPLADVAAGLAPAVSAVAPARSGVTAAITAPATRPPRRLVPLGLAAALAASLLVALVQSVGRTRAESRLATTAAELAQLRRTVAAQDTRLRDAETTLASVLDPAGDLTVVRLTATGERVPGVRFYWNRATRRGVLRVAGLDRAPEGKAYQLWLIRDGTPVPRPVFNATA